MLNTTLDASSENNILYFISVCLKLQSTEKSTLMTWGDSSHHTIKTTPCLYFDIFCNILWLCSHILYSVFYKCGASWSGFTATALRSNANGQKDDSQKNITRVRNCPLSLILVFVFLSFLVSSIESHSLCLNSQLPSTHQG